MREFKIIKVLVTDEEKLERYNFAKEEEKEGYYFGPPIPSLEDFMSRKIYDEFIKFKCLDCGYEETIELELVEEIFGGVLDPYPELNCSGCNEGTSVPIDVYNKKKLKVFR